MTITESKFILVLGVLILILSCSERREPLSITPHPSDWLNPQSANFHGKILLEKSLSIRSCKSCHGEDLSGGEARQSCTEAGCHELFPHPEGFADSLSVNFHATFIATNLNWNIIGCQTCHGSDYRGEGYHQKDCTVCHTAPDGPEACNTCHGSANNPAPPEDLTGNVNTTATGVGAHQTHLTDTTLTTSVFADCNHCHVKPKTYSDAGHVDNAPPPADIIFGFLASDTGNVDPAWNHESATCENVYCHGAFVFLRDSSTNPWAYADSTISGNNRAMIWTSVGSGQAECGTCHDLPPQGHITATTCNACHPRVVDSDFNIINKELHINGKIEVF